VIGRLRRQLGGSQRANGDEWVVFDVETTGLRPKTDRIVEIGLVRMTPDGRELDAWTTLVNPERDMGPVRIHGITARDVRDAPRFEDIAGDLLGHMSGARLAAHNSRFDVGFVGAELARLGIDWGPPQALCTMSLPYQLGVVQSRSLHDCCEELGIPYGQGHTALHDARAAAQLLTFTLARARIGIPRPLRTPDWPPGIPPCAVCLRGERHAAPERSALAVMAARLGVPDGISSPEDVAIAYLGLLDRVLEDRHITDDEVLALAEHAAAWDIDRDDAVELHAKYLETLNRRAWADGVLTDAEKRDLETVAELLGIPLEEYSSPPVGAEPLPAPAVALVRGAHQPGALAGQSVCFTGESVCTLLAVPLSRETQEQLAIWAGLTVKAGVSGKLDMLVLADPDSLSGKARKAAELGVRRIAEPVFWALAGVPVD
jgi:DNA polymerase III subunit epsilon